jgi:hypothetical protein
MSLITPEQFRVNWTQAQVDDRINALEPLSEIAFSKLSSLYHRFFGVLTGANDGEQIAKPESRNADPQTAKDRFVLNSCVRWQYPQIMDGIVADMESNIGYAITERYVTEDIPLLGIHSRRFQTKLKGIAALNVRQVWHDVLLDVPLTVFMETGLEGVLINPNTYAARIDDRLFTNPNDVFLRGDDYTVWPWFSDGTSPLSRNRVDHYWQLPINSRVRPYVAATPINVQHKKYVTVDIPAQEIPAGGQIFPVYPGTNQKIPQAQNMQVLESGDWRFTFYIYTLVHHDFYAETVDLIAGEFWKLYSTVDFKYVIDTAVAPAILVNRGTTQEILDPTLTLVDREDGVFHLNWDDCGPQALEYLCENWPQSIYLRISYKTSPDYINPLMRDGIGRLIAAAAARIASELPTYNCNCSVDYGFIAYNQTAYTDSYVSTQTGVVVDKLKYGRLQGQLYYAEVLNEAKKYARFRNVEILPSGFLNEF